MGSDELIEELTFTEQHMRDAARGVLPEGRGWWMVDATRVKEASARITALEEAVRVLGEEAYAWRTHTEENYYTNALRAAKKTDDNQIAAEAVRKAGG
jgi:hypothetical protein